MHQSLPTDLLPNPLVADYLDACTWWLANPSLVHYHGALVAERLAALPAMDNHQRRQLYLGLQQAQGRLRSMQGGLPETAEWPESRLHRLFRLISCPKEQSSVRLFSYRLSKGEYPWLAERLEAALRAREVEVGVLAEYLELD